MEPIRFEWDPRKAASNRRKHGVGFEEARSVFYDDDALVLGDARPGHDEERFVILGRSIERHVLVVCHCIRDEETIRIISARRANAHERRSYEEQSRS